MDDNSADEFRIRRLRLLRSGRADGGPSVARATAGTRDGNVAVLPLRRRKESVILCDDEERLAEQVADRLQAIRAKLPDTSLMAQAIDRAASWDEISACAHSEGLHDLTATLLDPGYDAADDDTSV